ncbi:MAG: DNA-binding transcriptional MocR family regulator [Gammaproteobacteria bacterium]|jgi:DNA-binding transcriptional MocR family regulator
MTTLAQENNATPAAGPAHRLPAQLHERAEELEARLAIFRAEDLALDLTRGKPSAAQLDLANGLDGILNGDFRSEDGSDTRNYGSLEGIPEMKRLCAEYLNVDANEVIVGGNSSLQLMYQYMLWARHYGPDGQQPWGATAPIKFLCPVPGYDRHFALTEELGIEMIAVPMDENGPNMARVEDLVRTDRAIRGMWCVPKHSNPSGATYSADVTARIANLGHIAEPGFRVMWDNAYAVHDLTDNPPELANILALAKAAGTQDTVVIFGSMSKVSFGGAGIAFMAATRANLDAFSARLSLMTIGPDKVNQLRHARFFKDLDGVRAHMHKHAAIVRPKFACVAHRLNEALGGKSMGSWNTPTGGYFVSFDAPKGTASRIVALAREHGVKLTPAGAAFPYGNDPHDQHIRLAPTFPALDELDKAMQVFVACVELVSIRHALGSNI